MRFNNGKCRVLHLERYNHMRQYRLGADLLERSSAENNPGVVDNRLAMSQQCVPVSINAIFIMGCTKNTGAG